MKSPSSPVLVVLAFLFFSGIAIAAPRESVQLRKGDTLSSVMARAGCKPEWLSEVMRVSRITSVAQLRRLPVGFRVNFPTGCNETAPVEIARASFEFTVIDKSQSNSNQQQATLKEEILKLKEENAGLKRNPEAARLQAEVERLRAEVASSKEQLQSSKKEVETVSAALARQKKSPFLFGLTGVIIASLVWWLLLIALKPEMADKQEAKLYRFGELYVFKQFSEAGFKCPLCNENNLKFRNVARHLDGKHPEIRLVGRKKPTLAFNE